MPLGSCHSDCNPLLLGQEPNLPRCEVPGSTCPAPHSCLTLAFWALAHFQFLDCAVLSPIGLLWAVLQFLMLPPTPYKAHLPPSPAQASLPQGIFAAPTPPPHTAFGDQVLCHMLSENHASFLQNTSFNLQLHIY